jgi:flavodoxin
MKIAIISYSLTGNNEALANRIASEMKTEHIRVTENKRRSTVKILTDMIFGRTPKVRPGTEVMECYDTIVFVGPVWMGQAASPLRAYFGELKAKAVKYAYVSISGGALGSNPKLAADLKKRTGKDPELVIDRHIADLLPKEPKPTTKDTSAYHVTGGDIEKLTNRMLGELKIKLFKNTSNEITEEVG